jgi:membrane-bound ClpP family serine protease
MIEGYALVAVLLGVAVALLVAELLLPTHGLLGVAGLAAAVAGIVVCTRLNAWAGLGLTLALVAATPLLWGAWLKVWPKTPVGRRMILTATISQPPEAPVHVGQVGVTVSELRPMGVCELEDGTRVEALSEHGLVPPGTAVRVIAVANNRPTVRVMA